MIDIIPLRNITGGKRVCSQCEQPLGEEDLGINYHYVKWHESDLWYPSCTKCQGVAHEEITLSMFAFKQKRR